MFIFSVYVRLSDIIDFKNANYLLFSSSKLEGVWTIYPKNIAPGKVRVWFRFRIRISIGGGGGQFSVGETFLEPH